MAGVIKLCVFTILHLVSFSSIQICLAEECTFNPCFNGGSCTTDEGKYHCRCPHSYTGIVCEHFVAEPATPAPTTTTTVATTTTEDPLPHACLFSPCLNNGFCVQTRDNYDCFCAPNYGGVLCDSFTGVVPEVSPDDLPKKCPFNPCVNGGFCVIAGSDYKCFCPTTHRGPICDQLAIETTTTTTTEAPTTEPVTETAATTPEPTLPPISIIPSVGIWTTSKHTTASVPTTPLPPTSNSSVNVPNEGGNSTGTTVTSVPKPSDGACRIDLEFLLDASGSVQKKNFKIQLNFTEALVRSLRANDNDVRVGLATFSTKVDNMFWMHDNTTDNIIAAIRQVPYISGNTHTELALDFALQKAFNTENGGRPDAADVVLIITDGTSKDPSLTQQAAKALHQTGAVVVAVGVGDFLDLAELKLIASDPSHVFTVSDYAALRNVESDLVMTSCAAGQLL